MKTYVLLRCHNITWNKSGSYIHCIVVCSVAILATACIQHIAYSFPHRTSRQNGLPRRYNRCITT